MKVFCRLRHVNLKAGWVLTCTWSVAGLEVWDDCSCFLCGIRQIFLQDLPKCLGVCKCVGVFFLFLCSPACVHALLQKERALAPESALWGDHSCTLPAANWSLSSCPIHLHFLPITEHYLCSQLGMGLNPFWLSWCYSLEIYKWRKRWRGVFGWGGVRVWGVHGGWEKTGWSRSRSKNKLWNFPSSLIATKESINNDITCVEGGDLKRSIIGVIIQVLVCKRCSLIDWAVLVALNHYWLVKTIFSHHQCFYVLCTRVTIRFYGALIIQHVFIWFKIVLCTVLTIWAGYTPHPEGTSRCRNLG